MTHLSRRDFLLSAAVGAMAVARPLTGPAVAVVDPVGLTGRRLIDTNTTLGQWPLRRLPLADTAALVAKLEQHGVVQAWAASFDALLHRDLAGVNNRLAAECKRHGRGILVPIGCVNPTLPRWEEDLQRCHEGHGMPGIRLYPNYNGYTLQAPQVPALLDRAAGHGMFVQIVLALEDERMQHPPMQVPPVEAAPLLKLLVGRPELRIQLLNWSRALKPALLVKLAATGRAWFDIATLEGVGGVANLAKQVPVNRIVFGSLAPLFYFESAALKLKESALTRTELSAICHENAAELSGTPVPRR